MRNKTTRNDQIPKKPITLPRNPPRGQPREPVTLPKVRVNIGTRTFFAVLDLSRPGNPSCVVYEEHADSLSYVGHELYTPDYPNPSVGLMLCTINRMVGGYRDDNRRTGYMT